MTSILSGVVPSPLLDLLRKIRRFWNAAALALQNRWHQVRFRAAARGTPHWLIATEIKYGGYVTAVPRRRVSPKDPRTREELAIGGMTGGDRMLHHGYAKHYSEHLLPLVTADRRIVLAEIGILTGSGLATWSELFPSSRLLGFDIDLGYVRENLDRLERRGAFRTVRPELYEFDQLQDNRRLLESIVNGEKIDVCIDDGLHSIDAVRMTLDSFIPFLSEQFLYFIEDNAEAYHQIRVWHPDLRVERAGELTIISRH